MSRYIIALLLMLCSVDVYSTNRAIVSSTSPMRIQRKDRIDLSIYSWPRTLVSYPVAFSENVKSESDLDLYDNIKKQSVAFQLSDKITENGVLKSGVLNFFAELPAGGEYDFTLYVRRGKAPRVENPVTIDKKTSSWVIGDGHYGVEIPSSRVCGDTVAPAPVISVVSNGREIGNNVFHAGRHRVKEIKTSILESGDLFAECGVRYILDDASSYYAKIKIVQGYPFVIFDEEIDNVSKKDGLYIDMVWDNFEPTRRYGNWDRQKEVSVDGGLPIDKPIYTNWCQEDPHWTGMGWVEDPSQQMLYRLLPFGGNSTREQVPAISFWETKESAAELGIFVYDHNRWDDRQYGIWQPTPDLSVYFKYNNGKLHFKYPVVSGTRSTAITFYNIKENQNKVDSFNENIDKIARAGGADSSDEMGFRYAMMLHRQYSLLNLNTVKDWVLEYPEGGFHPQSPFTGKTQSPSADEFHHQIVTSPMAYYMTGLNGFPGIHSISHRKLFGGWTEDYLKLYGSLSKKQREQVDGLFLISAYVNMLEAMNTIRTSLAGTANMAADGWAVPGQMSFLYPEHPMAREWADFFEKSLNIYGLFYTRPEVKAYESNGGRWVESLGIYNWAFLRPTTATNTALQVWDGKNRFADEFMAKRGHWMLDMTTAPVVFDNNLERCYAPHGAHGGGRIVPRYCSVYQLADWMRYYDPMLAENLYWLGAMGPGVETKDSNTNWPDVHKKLYAGENRGTNPHLKSTKYTGHGIVLRAGVDTDEELSIHLNQIDKGPNYRWGHQGQGNAGGIYFYAKGKIYTGHENEVVGDHMQNNLDGVTNFGVMKDGAFRNIGMNELVAPLYDLDIAQYAELQSAKGNDCYAWPEYLSRSIMLVGTDYFLIFDHTGTNWRAGARFSWFVQKQDEFPQIVFFGKSARPDHWCKAEMNNSKGFYRDADNSLLTLVTHKKGEISILNGKLKTPSLMKGSSVYEFVPADKEAASNVLYVKTAKSNDIVFRDGKEINYENEDIIFDGEAGVIRRMNDGSLQLAMMKGQKISADGFTVELSQPGTAIALTRIDSQTCKGRYKGDGRARLSIDGLTGGRVFIDGVQQRGVTDIVLPEGEHDVEYAREATPMPTRVVATEYSPRGTLLHLDMPASVKKARIEVSTDNAETWQPVGNVSGKSYMLKSQPEGKIHVRAVSVNKTKSAACAPEYPVYTTNKAPHYPEGLRLKLGDNVVNLSWGNVLGVQKYHLYRRLAGENDFKLVYEGKSNNYIDSVPGVVKACKLPGHFDNQNFDDESLKIYEYVVTAVDGFGESNFSPVANTDPASWANWYPDTELRFKRTSAFWMEPYVHADMTPDKYYPE